MKHRAILVQVSTDVDAFQHRETFPVSGFLQKGFNISAFIKDVAGWQEDQSGIYFFRLRGVKGSEARLILGVKNLSEVIYVGHSRKISQRLSGHFKANKHNAASLVYRITVEKLSAGDQTRAKNMKDDKFSREFDKIRKFLARHIMASFHFEADPVKQPLSEILFSQRFETTFNEWETH